MLRFPEQPGARIRHGRIGLQFDGHSAAQPSVARPVDLAHGAGPKKLEDFVASERVACIEQSRDCSVGGAEELDHRPFDEVAGQVVALQKRIDLVTKPSIGSASGLHERRAALGRSVQGVVKHFFGSMPPSRVYVVHAGEEPAYGPGGLPGKVLAPFFLGLRVHVRGRCRSRSDCTPR